MLAEGLPRRHFRLNRIVFGSQQSAGHAPIDPGQNCTFHSIIRHGKFYYGQQGLDQG